tara:strand:+ start:6671 stop:7693 length:1023 start_codon:yes stop_codon:yes gene_type:complete
MICVLKDLCEAGFLDYSLSLDVFKPSCFRISGCEVHMLELGVIEFRPDRETSQAIVLSCGIHGNETAPIELCNQLIHDILTEKLQLAHRLQIQLGHLPAIVQQKRFVEENLNRLFAYRDPPPLDASYERHRAWLLQQATKQFFAQEGTQALHLDLHTSIRASQYPLFAVYPFLHHQPYNKRLLSFLAESEIKTLLLSHQPTSTYSYFSAQLGADAVTLELGQVKPFGKNNQEMLAPFRAALVQLLTVPTWEPESAWQSMRIFKVTQELIKHHQDFTFTFADEIKNFTTFERDAVLAYENDEPIYAVEDQAAIAFPNAQVALGERALLILKPYELNSDDIR